MIVYRYMSEQFGLLALQQCKWKIGRLLELNDPMDCRPKLLRSGGAAVPADEPLLNEIFDSVGILCYSESINDPVIWSHYADSHRGMALGFEYDPTKGELFKVEYPAGDDRAVLEYDVLAPLWQKDQVQALLEVITKGYTRKAKSWEYEREHRQFIYLFGCTMEGPHYFREIPLPNLKRVILGAKSRVTESDVRRIRQKWQHKGVEIKKAKMDTDKYRMID